METYNLPYYQKSGFRWHMYLLSFISIIFLTAGSGFFLIVMRKDELVLSLFYGLFCIALDLLIIYMIIYAGILKKCYIEMTSEYLSVSTLFKTRKVYWNEIYEVNMFYSNNNTFIGVLLKNDRLKKQKRTILNNLNSLMGFSFYSFKIGLAFFKDVDKVRLLETILGQIDKNPQENYFLVNDTDVDEEQNNIFKAIIASILICIILSGIYGFSIYELGVNFIPIPVFGAFIIISFFNKYYLEKSFKLSIRLFLALLCVCQILLAIVGYNFFAFEFPFSLEMLQAILIDHFHDLFSDQIFLTLMYILCFGLGFFRGRKSNEVQGNGFMNIINNENFISNSQLEEVINLLGEEYNPERIVIFENQFESFKYSIKNYFHIAERELKGMSYIQKGQTVKLNFLTDTVKIFLDNIKNINMDKEEKQVNLIYDLVVELKRRYYLIEKIKEKGKKLIEVSDTIDTYELLTNDTYVSLIYNFASNFMNENADKLSEIMNWNEKWTYEK